MRFKAILGAVALSTALSVVLPNLPASAAAGQSAKSGHGHEFDGQLRGVNLAGAEFGPDPTPGNLGTYGTTYEYPNAGEVDYFMSKGMNTIRVPFRWERMQHTPFAEFDREELRRLDTLVRYATGKGATIILDPHNYARYYGNLIGSPQVSNAAFADFWARLAREYAGNSHVIFNLMNEPNQMPTEQWLAAANAAIKGIRSTHARQLILVPGNAWTGGKSWTQNWYGTSNSVAMLNVVDPLNNFQYDIHTYFDSDASGTHKECVTAAEATAGLDPLIKWLHVNHRKAFIGEFNGANTPACFPVLDAVLSYYDTHSDVISGWTIWAAGPIWGTLDSLEPKNHVDAPQLPIYRKHLPACAQVHV